MEGSQTTEYVLQTKHTTLSGAGPWTDDFIGTAEEVLHHVINEINWRRNFYSLEYQVKFRKITTEEIIL